MAYISKLVDWEGSGQMTEVGTLFDLVTDWGYDDW